MKRPAPKKHSTTVPENGDGTECRLTFSPGEWADIEKCAAYEQTAPAQWARQAVLSWIPETLDAIRREELTPEEQAAEEASIARTISNVRLVMGAADLNLSRDEAEAFGLCAGWEGTTFAEMARTSILACLESSFSEMERFASAAKGFRHGGKPERAWARRWHKYAAPIMARLGFHTGAFHPCRTLLPDRPSGTAGQRDSGTAGKVAFPLCGNGKKSSPKCGKRKGLKDENQGTERTPAHHV